MAQPSQESEVRGLVYGAVVECLLDKGVRMTNENVLMR